MVKEAAHVFVAVRAGRSSFLHVAFWPNVRLCQILEGHFTPLRTSKIIISWSKLVV